MPKGIIKFYNESKGYGFVKNEETNEDVFIHASGLVDQVKEGDSVSFEIVDGKKGLNATEVRLQ